MRYTLDQACDRLAGYSHAYGVTDVRTSINAAIQALAGLSGWECLRRVVRISSASPVFALPQGCAGLVRACVDGRPLTVRGQDFQFIQSGPGDVVARPPRGFMAIPPANIERTGERPYMIEPASKPFQLFAFTEGTSEPYITVRGVDVNGRLVRVNLPMHERPVYDPASGALLSGTEPQNTDPDSCEMNQILEVVLDKCATSYVSLYARYNDGTTERLAQYHPSVRVPVFEHYRIANLPADKPVEVLAEVRVDPLPLIDDNDVLPFEGIEPIEYMILYAWKMASSEIDAARKYKEEAATWLRAQEVAANTVQTQLTINSVFSGSMGEVSMEAANI